MISNRDIIDELYNQYSNSETIRILNDKEKKDLGYISTYPIWEIDTEIHLNFDWTRIVFHVLFLDDFPFNVPKVYLSPEYYDKFKFIPHVDTERSVCTFDSELISTNPKDPLGVLIGTLKRAKEIVVEGLNGKNKSDFENEFIAYWEGKYEKSEKVPLEILSLIDTLINPNDLKLLCLKSHLKGYEYVLCQNNNEGDRFKSYLNAIKIEFSEVEVFYIEKLEDFSKPPFNLRNRETLRFISGNDLNEKFKRFINCKTYPKLFISSKIINGHEFLYGWFYEKFITDVKGFRPGFFRPIDALNKTQGNSLVRRMTTNKFTFNRLTKRTTGEVVESNRPLFAIAGIGSIGSNLCFYLNTINFPDFYLIDFEKLKIENIARHFLGFNSIGEYKTKGLQKYIVKSGDIEHPIPI